MGTELMTLKGHDDGVWSAVYSPDGQRIVTASNDTAEVWDAETGTQLLTLKGYSAAYSPDGQRIVTAGVYGDMRTRVWDAETGTQLLTLKGYSVAYSPDGQRILTLINQGRTAKVWDANTGKELFTLLIGHDGKFRSAAYSPDGQRIVISVAATAGDIIQIYTTDMGELLHIANSRVTRQLTAEEKEKYGVPD
jgi:WD40 repeat protein